MEQVRALTDLSKEELIKQVLELRGLLYDQQCKPESAKPALLEVPVAQIVVPDDYEAEPTVMPTMAWFQLKAGIYPLFLQARLLGEIGG